MNKRQKLVQQQFLNNEEAVIKRLKSVYTQSLKDIEKKSQAMQDDINRLQGLINTESDADEKARLLSMQQSKVYQKQYQDALKKQVGSILDNMQVEEFKTISEYLATCYEDGFIGTMYDLQGQGIPLCFPLDQEAMVRAVQLDSKISQGLYTRLGEDVAVLKKKIAAQVSRGIATGMTFQQVAQQLAGYTNIGYNNAVRIARTEGHRVAVQSGMDACYKAKERGADVVKQWDATLDDRTRESHAAVDGEIRELDEPFSNGLMFPSDSSGGAAEVVNCRCALLQRARWALTEGELDVLKERAAFFGLDKTEQFEDYKKKYLSAAESINDNTFVKNATQISDKIESAEMLTVDDFPDAFRRGAEKKNTQNFVDYVNGVEGANPDTIQLYKSMGKLESIESEGKPFKISHSKNHQVQTTQYFTGELAEVKLNIPKLSGDDLTGQIGTTLHENMHMIDLYCRSDKKLATGWFTESCTDLLDQFKDPSTVKMGSKVAEFFKKQSADYKATRQAVSAVYKKKKDDLREAYFPNGASFWDDIPKYRIYEKELKKLNTEMLAEIDYQCRNVMNGGNALQDIYDALSGGAFRDNGTVTYGHGSKYYRNINSRAHETIANYGVLSVTRPDLVEMLREDYPDLVSELENTVKKMLEKAGE